MFIRLAIRFCLLLAAVVWHDDRATRHSRIAGAVRDFNNNGVDAATFASVPLSTQGDRADEEAGNSIVVEQYRNGHFVSVEAVDIADELTVPGMSTTRLYPVVATGATIDPKGFWRGRQAVCGTQDA